MRLPSRVLCRSAIIKSRSRTTNSKNHHLSTLYIQSTSFTPTNSVSGADRQSSHTPLFIPNNSLFNCILEPLSASQTAAILPPILPPPPFTTAMSALIVDVVSAMLIPSFAFKLYFLDRRSRLFVTSMLLRMICFLATPVLSLCECGYTSPIGTSANTFVFTDLIESDFLHIKNVSLDTDWRRQNFSVTAEAARGPYGYVLLFVHSVPFPASNPHSIFSLNHHSASSLYLKLTLILYSV